MHAWKIGIRINIASSDGGRSHVHRDAETYKVEFVTAEGRTVAVLTLPIDVLRKPEDYDMLHVRSIASA